MECELSSENTHTMKELLRTDEDPSVKYSLSQSSLMLAKFKSSVFMLYCTEYGHDLMSKWVSWWPGDIPEILCKIISIDAFERQIQHIRFKQFPSRLLLLSPFPEDYPDNRPKKLSYHIEIWYLDLENYHIISKVIFRFSQFIISYHNWYSNFKMYHIISKMIFKFSKLSNHIKNEILMFKIIISYRKWYWNVKT